MVTDDGPSSVVILTLALKLSRDAASTVIVSVRLLSPVHSRVNVAAVRLVVRCVTRQSSSSSIFPRFSSAMSFAVMHVVVVVGFFISASMFARAAAGIFASAAGGIVMPSTVTCHSPGRRSMGTFCATTLAVVATARVNVPTARAERSMSDMDDSLALFTSTASGRNVEP